MSHGTAAAATLARLRERAPLVHNITNYVSMDVAANGLLAIGASPVMAHAAEEVRDFVGIAGALVINIGTLSREWVAAMLLAADAATERGLPWALDPVGVGATPYRNAVARDLVARRPTVIRGNASEIMALAGQAVKTKGVDSTRGADEARDAARALATEVGCTVAATGKVDYVTDGRRALAVANGHPLMTTVTALGCTATAIVGACLAVEGDALHATAHALSIVGVCGERAAEGDPGPGTFRVRFMDALHQLDGAALERAARITDA